jgi:ABC-type polysaccharide transport system permease subunit
MQSAIVGFRYATRRWLALISLSLVLFFLVLKYFPLFGALVLVGIYRQKRITTNKQATYTKHKRQHNKHHKTNKYKKQTSLYSEHFSKFLKALPHLFN